jgi:putative flippase GtrA
MSTFTTLLHHRIPQFFIVGSCGAALNLGMTWALTTFVFGLHQYFFAYLCGIAVNLTFNFTLYTISIFKTKTQHVRRLFFFVLYSLLMTYVQADVVKVLTPWIGFEFYLLIIAGTILAFAAVNFLVFKLALFKEARVVMSQ